MHTLFTIEYFNLSFEDMLEMLQTAGVQVLVNVREMPASENRKFDRETLPVALKQEGITYMSFADKFKSQNPLDESFKNGIRRLTNGIAQGYKIALFHSNKDKTLLSLIGEQLAGQAVRLQPIVPNHLPYTLAEDFALRSNKCIFLTGKAGTGKTTFLKHLKEISPKNMAIVAPTGVAAINAGGMTIHSLFQLPVRTLIPTVEAYRQMFAEQRMTQRKRNMLYHLEMLVIDEISMVRADVLDAIDAVLRHYKYRRDLPFGGVQVLMIGDLMQLSPVVTSDDAEAMRKYYDNPYFFSSRVMQQLRPVYIELNHVFRQQNEQFINLLNEVRDNRLSPQSKTLLASRYQPHFQNTEDNFHITLTTHNYMADTLNKSKLAALKGEQYAFEASVNGNFPESSYPADFTLELKVGARVMFIRNDDQKPRRFFNGKLGVIADIDNEQITMQCEDETIEVGRMTWENIRYREDAETGKITEETLGSFTQFPLRLAWAITIHKSQGLTFDRVIIDAERAFAAGQVYVALSRCRTLEGIVLTSPLQNVSLSQERGVIEYVNQQPSISETAQSLTSAKRDYLQQILLELFGFHRVQTLVEQMQKLVRETVSFNEDTPAFLSSLRKQTDELLPVSQTFSRQIVQMLNENNLSLLQQRLHAAADYFIPSLQTLAAQLSTQPCRSKNKSDADDYMVFAAELFLTLHQKIAFMKAMADEVTSDAYLQAKRDFVAPRLQVESILLKPERKTKEKAAKKPKERKPKVDTYALTYEMLQNGFDIEAIARMRSLSVNTIWGHVMRFVGEGKIDVEEYVLQEAIARIRMAQLDHPEMNTLSEFYALLKGEIDYNVLRVVLAAKNE